MICEAWVDRNDLAACDCPDADGAVMDQASLVASEILYLLTGRQWSGFCTETVRPCSGGLNLPYNWPYPTYPELRNGTWTNLSCGCHVSYDCGCKGFPQVDLGRSDISEIFTVNIDGTALSASSYRLDHGRWLVRTDGSQWPCCQDLSKDIGEEGTWYVELEYGREPPASVKFATARYATELVKGCVGDSSCALPDRVSSITRQGVSIAVLDPMDFIDDGKTGVYVVDQVIKATNPKGLRRRATAWSPGLPGRGRRVGIIGS